LTDEAFQSIVVDVVSAVKGDAMLRTSLIVAALWITVATIEFLPILAWAGERP
jgi:hypothetical protein